MDRKFIPLGKCPSIDIFQLKDTDNLLMSILNEEGKNNFGKLSASILIDSYRYSFLNKIGLEGTYDPYLFRVYFSDYDYNYGISKLESYRNASSILSELPIVYDSSYPGGCSAIHLNNYVAHNYDCKFDDLVSFIVSTPMVTETIGNELTLVRHATLSLSSRIRELSKNFVTGKYYSDNYNLIPFYVINGINDVGLCITVNSIRSNQDPNFDGTSNYHTIGTNPEGTDVCAFMLARILLDKCSNITECISELTNWNVWCPCIDPFSTEFSWTISDASGRIVCLEIINNEFKVLEVGREGAQPHISTNFYLWKYNGNISDIIIENGLTNDTLTDYANGLERYVELVKFNINNGSEPNLRDLLNVLKSIRYSNLYNNELSPKWYSDYCNNWGDPYGNLTIHSAVNDFQSIYNNGISNYAAQKLTPIRLGVTKFTSNSVIYDLGNKSMKIRCQESDDLMEFKL